VPMNPVVAWQGFSLQRIARALAHARNDGGMSIAKS